MDEKKEFLHNDIVWGYRDKDGTVCRNYFNDFLKIDQIGNSLVIYSRRSRGFRNRGITTYYF